MLNLPDPPKGMRWKIIKNFLTGGPYVKLQARVFGIFWWRTVSQSYITSTWTFEDAAASAARDALAIWRNKRRGSGYYGVYAKPNAEGQKESRAKVDTRATIS